MKKSQTLELRASAIREKLNVLSGTESLTEEQRSEVETLTTEYGDVETRRRAAIVSEDVEAAKETPGEPGDAEERERLELRGRALVSDFLTAALTGRSVPGASAEYAEACQVQGRMPLDLLATPEERAVTPGPSAETVTASRPTVPAAFARTDAAGLGVAMPMVAPGEAHYPALGDGSAGGTEGERRGCGFDCGRLRAHEADAGADYRPVRDPD